jgi:signal transduction histidine kinase
MKEGNSKASISDAEPFPQHQRASYQLGIIEWLARAKATTGLRSAHFWIILCLFAAFGYTYYGVLTSFHDVYVIIFFYPLIYAAIIYRLRGVIISGLVFLGILLPHAIFFSSETYSLVTSLLLAIFGLLISGLGATLLNYLEQQFEAYQEILSLNEELNSYIKRLESAQKQLIQAEKLNALGQLAASIAHEINNPLAGVVVYVKLLLKKISSNSLDKGEALTTMSKIESAVIRCSGIVRGLLDFARQSEPELKPIAVSSVVDQVMSLVGHQAEMKNIKVNREDVSPLPQVIADSNQLQQVFVNLVVNAIQAMHEGGMLTIRSSLGKDGYVRVSIQDTGYGIPPENLEKLFTPFFTTKETGKGVGLGLAVSHGIIERHGGRIEVQTEVGKGSTFTIYLPAHGEDVSQ